MAETVQPFARSLDEQLVATLEYYEGCVSGPEGVFPPPPGCSDAVSVVYGLASWHVFSIVIAGLFVLMLVSLTMGIFGGGEHH